MVGYSKIKAKILEQKFQSDFKEREVHVLPHETEKREEYGVSDLLDCFLALDEVKALKSHRDVVCRTEPLKGFFENNMASKLLPSEKAPFLRKLVEEIFERKGGNPRRIHGRVFAMKCIQNVSNVRV